MLFYKFCFKQNIFFYNWLLSRTGLVGLKTAGGFFCFCFKKFCFLLTPSSSLSFFLFLFLLSFSPFLSLLPSFLFFFFFNSHKWTIKRGTMKRPELDRKRGHPNSWDSETNFTLLLQRTCKLLYICIIFFIILTSFILLVFLYFSSFGLVFFTWLVKLHYLTGCPCFLFHSVFLIYSLSLHLCSISTLLEVLYFLFLLSRSHRFCHRIVAPL